MYGGVSKFRSKFKFSFFFLQLEQVKIKVLDMNDNVPEFSKADYTLNIGEEATPVGLPLLTLNAASKDLNSELEYSIEAGNENDMFSLIKPENTRVFLTLKRSNLNYKKQANYSLQLKVMDAYSGLYSLANVQVNVLPSKNLSPRFTKDTYVFKIKESAPLGSLVGSLAASFYQVETLTIVFLSEYILRLLVVSIVFFFEELCYSVLKYFLSFEIFNFPKTPFESNILEIIFVVYYDNFVAPGFNSKFSPYGLKLNVLKTL